MESPERKIPISLDWGKIRDDSDLDPEIFKPVKSPSAEMARRMERDLFIHMKAWHVSKVYFWDEYHTLNGTYRWAVDGTYRWDLCFGPVMPEGVDCREHDFTNLVEMSNLEFERFVRSLPPSPNVDVVREWRREMRGDTGEPEIDWRDLPFDPDLIKKELL